MSVKHDSSAARLMLAVVFGIALIASADFAAAQTVCPANGNDTESDWETIQTCLNQGGDVWLDADVTNGYYIDRTLFLTQSGQTFRGVSNFGYKALLFAMSSLSGPLIDGNASNYRVEQIMLYGNKFGRSPSECATGNGVLRGSFTVYNIESRDAVCGTGLAVEGTFTITNSWFVFNGFAEPGPWADGLTVWNCQGGTVAGNTFWDNTDVDLIVGGGNCTVEDNTISHMNTYGFAGLMIGWFPGGDGNHTGSVFQRNNISSSADKLGFGIMVGSHPWTIDWPFVNAGTITGNSSSGAVINLMVEATFDGGVGGTVSSNGVSGAQGSNGFLNCTVSSNYAAAHLGSLSIQPGAQPLIYDNGSCSP